MLQGLKLARGEFLVMDADLQHPPERICDLLSPLEQDDAEFVLGSRCGPAAAPNRGGAAFGGSTAPVATALARPFAPGIRDPMSGFFALRRQTLDRARDLNPVGYKIALELICKSGATRVVEVPIEFALRQAGQSKLDLRQQVRLPSITSAA